MPDAGQIAPSLGHNRPPPEERIGIELIDPKALTTRLDADYDRIMTRFVELEQGIARMPAVIGEPEAQRILDFVSQQCKPAIEDAQAAHKREKAAYLACSRAIDNFFLRRIDTFNLALAKVSRAAAEYFERKKTEQRQAEQRQRQEAAAEAARLREAQAEAERQVKQHEANNDRIGAMDYGRHAEHLAGQAAEAEAIAAAPDAPVRIHGEYGATAYAKEEWLYEVDDPTLIPLQYLEPSDPAIKAALKRGVREIPGLRIYREDKFIMRKC
jgi:hypothetical protein